MDIMHREMMTQIFHDVGSGVLISTTSADMA